VRDQAEQAIEFMERLNLNPANGGGWVERKRGRHGGGTWAREQVGVAYAQYLSAEFYIWCNDIIRASAEIIPALRHGISKPDRSRAEYTRRCQPR
jgi:KilA-N domain